VSTLVGSDFMGVNVNTDDVIDAQGVAHLLGLAQRNTVSSYQKRYPDMPRPVIDLGLGRCKLWRRSEVVMWILHRGAAPTVIRGRKG
jgi:predicted DNA-binding transcriptional regulator AlpA